MMLPTRILVRACKIGIFFAVLIALTASAPVLLAYWIWLITASRRRHASPVTPFQYATGDLGSDTHKPVRKTLLLR